jgi:hypothetical protein
MADIEEIAKSAANEAAKISTKEATVSTAEEARKAAEELEKPSGNPSDPVRTDVELEVAGGDG